MGKNCISQVYVDFTSAGEHRGSSNFYIKHNLFHQSKLWRKVELYNTHIVHFDSPQEVMQICVLDAQLGFESELIDWCRDATSVSFGDILSDSSP